MSTQYNIKYNFIVIIVTFNLSSICIFLLLYYKTYMKHPFFSKCIVSSIKRRNTSKLHGNE